MRRLDELTPHGRLRRFRGVALAALDACGVRSDALVLVGHDENVTFRVHAGTSRYLLRIHRRAYHDAAVVASELTWLRALRRDVGSIVPEPVAVGGDGVLHIQHDALDGEALCTVLQWMDGRQHVRHPSPMHLFKLGGLMALLHEQAAAWTPPARFVRPTWDAAGLFGAQPNKVHGDDAHAAVPAEYRPLFADAAMRFEAATRALGRTRAAFGLIHGDLHSGNVVFRGGTARAIDFEDCGWGWYGYDIVAVSQLFPPFAAAGANRAAFVAGYREVRALGDDVLAVLDTLRAGRLVGLGIWLMNRARTDPRLRTVIEPWLIAGRRTLETLLERAA